MVGNRLPLSSCGEVGCGGAAGAQDVPEQVQVRSRVIGDLRKEPIACVFDLAENMADDPDTDAATLALAMATAHRMALQALLSVLTGEQRAAMVRRLREFARLDFEGLTDAGDAAAAESIRSELRYLELTLAARDDDTAHASPPPTDDAPDPPRYPGATGKLPAFRSGRQPKSRKR